MTSFVCIQIARPVHLVFLVRPCYSFLVSGYSKSGKYKDGGQSPGNYSHQKFGDCSQVISIWKADLDRENFYFDLFQDQIYQRRLELHTTVFAVAFSPCGNYLATCNNFGQIAVFRYFLFKVLSLNFIRIRRNFLIKHL